MSLYHGCRTLTRRFRLVLSSFLQSDGLPFGDTLPEEEIERAFDAERTSRWSGTEATKTKTPSTLPPSRCGRFSRRCFTAASSAVVRRPYRGVVVLLVALGRAAVFEQHGRLLSRSVPSCPKKVLRRLTLQTWPRDVRGRGSFGLALARPPCQAGRWHDRLDAGHRREPDRVSAADGPGTRGWDSRSRGWWCCCRWPPACFATWPWGPYRRQGNGRAGVVSRTTRSPRPKATSCWPIDTIALTS